MQSKVKSTLKLTLILILALFNLNLLWGFGGKSYKVSKPIKEIPGHIGLQLIENMFIGDYKSSFASLLIIRGVSESDRVMIGLMNAIVFDNCFCGFVDYLDEAIQLNVNDYGITLVPDTPIKARAVYEVWLEEGVSFNESHNFSQGYTQKPEMPLSSSMFVKLDQTTRLWVSNGSLLSNLATLPSVEGSTIYLDSEFNELFSKPSFPHSFEHLLSISKSNETLTIVFEKFSSDPDLSVQSDMVNARLISGKKEYKIRITPEQLEELAGKDVFIAYSQESIRDYKRKMRIAEREITPRNVKVDVEAEMGGHYSCYTIGDKDLNLHLQIDIEIYEDREIGRIEIVKPPVSNKFKKKIIDHLLIRDFFPATKDGNSISSWKRVEIEIENGEIEDKEEWELYEY
jgi:hypothetical protein